METRTHLTKQQITPLWLLVKVVICWVGNVISTFNLEVFAFKSISCQSVLTRTWIISLLELYLRGNYKWFKVLLMNFSCPKSFKLSGSVYQTIIVRSRRWKQKNRLIRRCCRQKRGIIRQQGSMCLVNPLWHKARGGGKVRKGGSVG